MFRKLRGIICLILIMQLSSIISIAQITKEKEIKENYKKLLSEDFEERGQALHFFNKLRKEELNKKIFDTVIDLFRKEKGQKGIFEIKKDVYIVDGVLRIKKKAYTESEADRIGELYGMYIGNMCEIVGKSGDIKILSLLVEHCLEPKAILSFGDAAVEPVIDIISNPPSIRDKRSLAIRVLAEMLKPKKEGYVASGEARNKIKEVLIQAASDKDQHVRSVSVRALGDSGDEDVLPILEKIAQSDPFSVEKKDPFTGKTITDPATGKTITLYPMREEAQKAIQKIKEKKKPEGK